MLMPRVRTIVVLVSTLQLAAPALAAKKESKESAAAKEANERAGAQKEARDAKVRAAKKACLNGDPAKGIEILTDLYVDTSEPTHVYNQGRCYEQNARYEEAIARFREYLRKAPGASEADRADVQQHIADCEAMLAKKVSEAAESTSGSEPVAPATIWTPAPPGAQTGTSAVAAPAAAPAAAPQPNASAGSGLRVAGVVTMAVGGAALVAGLVFNLQHNSLMDESKTDPSGDKASKAETYKTVSMVSYGAGAVFLVAGVTMYLLGYSAGKTAVAPAVVAGGPGAVLVGSF
jgi:tetratricopeptide (TPR) repeat protein